MKSRLRRYPGAPDHRAIGLDRTIRKAYVSGVLVSDRDSRLEMLPETFLRWFAGRGWSPREHQLALLAKARDDRSALLIAPTGAGKTLAGFLPTLVELSSPSPPKGGGEKLVSTGRGVARSRGLHTLY